MPLQTQLSLALTATHTSALDLTTVSAPVSKAFNKVLTSGTGANQADKIFHDQRTLAASGSENLDLAAVLLDAFGSAITFARIKLILITAAAANTNNVLVGGHGSAAFINWVSDASDKIVVRPGGAFCLIAPDATAYAVTATTGDMLTVANSTSGSSVTYDVILAGCSA